MYAKMIPFIFFVNKFHSNFTENFFLRKQFRSNDCVYSVALSDGRFAKETPMLICASYAEARQCWNQSENEEMCELETPKISEESVK
jgi:hypothetical protein